MEGVSLEEATAKLKTVTPEWIELADSLCGTPASLAGAKA
jgi:hypothetical protein